MSDHTQVILNILTQQGPLEQRKKQIERELASMGYSKEGSTRRFRDPHQKARIIELNQELTKIIKKLSILHKAEVLATKKAMAEIEGETYTITIADVEEVGGTQDDLGELEHLLSGLGMNGGRRKSRKTRKTRKNKSRK